MMLDYHALVLTSLRCSEAMDRFSTENLLLRCDFPLGEVQRYAMSAVHTNWMNINNATEKPKIISDFLIALVGLHSTNSNTTCRHRVEAVVLGENGVMTLNDAVKGMLKGSTEHTSLAQEHVASPGKRPRSDNTNMQQTSRQRTDEPMVAETSPQPPNAVVQSTTAASPNGFAAQETVDVPRGNTTVDRGLDAERLQSLKRIATVPSTRQSLMTYWTEVAKQLGAGCPLKKNEHGKYVVGGILDLYDLFFIKVHLNMENSNQFVFSDGFATVDESRNEIVCKTLRDVVAGMWGVAFALTIGPLVEHTPIHDLPIYMAGGRKNVTFTVTMHLYTPGEFANTHMALKFGY
jgi:hypothetical protein